MTHWEAFLAVAAVLASPEGRAPIAQAADESAWDTMLAVAAQHGVTPTLAWALAGVPALPPDVRDYLSATLDLNRMRNAAALDGLALAAGALIAAGCTPVVLKGAAAILDRGIHPDGGARYLSDADLLVPAPQVQDAERTLGKAGFRPSSVRWVRSPDPDHHHLPPLVHERLDVVLEVHRTITSRTFEPIAPTSDCLDRCHTLSFRGLDLRVLSPTDRITHHLVHGQLHHDEHRLGIVELRQVLDLALLSRRFAGEIDWPEVEARFRRAGHSDALRRQTDIVGALMGVRTMEPSSPDPEILWALQRLIEARPPVPRGGEGHSVARVAADYWHSFARHPLLALNLFNPSWWPQRVGTIRKRLRRKAAG